jgi:hypothetical protein
MCKVLASNTKGEKKKKLDVVGGTSVIPALGRLGR